MRQRFSSWLLDDQGQSLLTLESLCLNNLLRELRGHLGLLIAYKEQFAFTRSIKTYRTLALMVDTDLNTVDSDDKNDYPPIFIANPSDLPLARTSVDLVVIPHVLEFTANWKTVLDEIALTVCSQGHLVIMGFHPWSLFRITANMPLNCNLHSIDKISHYIQQLEFEIVAKYHYPYWPSKYYYNNQQFVMQSNSYWIHKITQYGQMLLGSIYVLIVKKNIIGMIKPQFKWQEITNNKASVLIKPAV